MQESKEKKSAHTSEILRAWLSGIPVGDYRTVIDMILKKCLISPTTFNNWRYGRCRIPLSGQRDLNELALEISGKTIFTIDFPGEPSGMA